jgi:YhcH/YjgK/YiaL family protein
MVLDRLTNSSATVPASVARALEFLRTIDPATLEPGRHEIDGDSLFAIVDDYVTLPDDQCRWEAHRAYVDVQYVVRGAERMGVMNLSRAVEREAYDPARDVAFFDPGEDFVTVHAGMFTVFGPEDVHAPKAAAGAPGRVRKIVMKVAVP